MEHGRHLQGIFISWWGAIGPIEEGGELHFGLTPSRPRVGLMVPAVPGICRLSLCVSAFPRSTRLSNVCACGPAD